jgi:YegS/Rv2252/BmrU family lipid kinase
MPNPAEIYVIYNPAAGRGKTARQIEALKRQLGARASWAPTERPGDAERLARQAVLDGWKTIGAAGGDGAVHETANGILAAANRDAVLAVFPLGSANDYAHVLSQRDAWSAKTIHDWPAPRTVDVGKVTAGAGRQRFFFNSFGLGFNCTVTHEARRIRFLRGVPLYTLALVRSLAKRFAVPEWSLTIDGVRHDWPTLSLTVLIGRREGNFKLAPQAIVDDGQFDYLHVGPLSRLRLLRYVPRMISGRIPTDDPAVTSGRCQSIEVSSDSPLSAHLDGELFCLHEDGAQSIKVEILPQALAVSLPKGQA